MAIINWSETMPRPARVQMSLTAARRMFTSPLTGATRVVAMPGARWRMEVEWPMARVQDVEALRALLLRLTDGTNQLAVWHLARPTIAGAGGGAPVVNGAGQTGVSISVSGLPANVTGVYQPGDMLGIGGELKAVTARADSNGSGVATVQFMPALRASPANGSAIVTARPTATFMVDASTTPAVLYMPGRIAQTLPVQLVEVF